MKMESSNWPNVRDDYDLLEVIGCGATSVVQEALCKTRGEKCAIKRIDLEKCSAQFDEILKELQMMSQSKHENVASFHTAFVVKDELWLVMPIMDGGSLLDILKHMTKKGLTKNGCLDETTIATILKETLTGLNYLHQNHLLHRDVKAGNILLSFDGSIKVADFGVSSWIYEGGNTSRRQRKTFVGTPCWMAPEVMEQVTGYDSKADIWSVGILALELATGHAPYAKFPPMKNDPPTLELCGDLNHEDYRKYSRMFRKFIDICLQKDTQARPTASELLRNEFVKKKAKGKEFLQQHLVPLAPKIKERSQKVHRVPGTSGRLHRTEDGEWEWSDEEFTGDADDRGKKSARVRPAAQLSNVAETSDKQPDQVEEQTKKDEVEKEEVDEDSKKQDEKLQLERPDVEQKKEPVKESLQASQTEPVSKETKDESPKQSSTDKSSKSLQLALKIRNKENKLKDIKFTFMCGSDTAGGISEELVIAGLVTPPNRDAVKKGIQQLVHRVPEETKIIFELDANPDGTPFEQTDKSALIGFAQVSVV